MIIRDARIGLTSGERKKMTGKKRPWGHMAVHFRIIDPIEKIVLWHCFLHTLYFTI